MDDKRAKPDRAIAEAAARQHGIVTQGQMLALGLTRSSISDRVLSGHLHRVHRGVYALGHADLNLHRRWMAAVRACGEGAVLSHASAAALWELIKPIDGPIDVSVRNGNGRKRQ